MSEEISCCANHTCTSKFDKTVDEYLTCSLCLQPAYCSDECRLLDWPTHACDNVHQTEHIKAGFAVPYYYEDMLSGDDLNDLPVDSPIFQSYQVMYCNANRTISQYVIPSLVEKNAESKDDEAPIARGKNPAKLLTLLNTNYTLRIAVGGRTVDVIGSIPNDMIFKENNANPTARALSGGGANFKEKVRNVFRGGLRRALHHAETSYIFWPQNRRLRDNLIEVDLAGDIEVWLLVKDASGKEKTISYVIAGYKLPVPGKKDVSAAGRKVQQMFRSQLELKFKGSDLSTKNLYVRRYSDFEGNGIILTFEITPGSYKAKLVDIEYVVDAERVKVAEIPADVPTVDTKGSLKKTLGDVGITKDGDDDEAPPPPPPDEETKTLTSQYKCNVRDFEDIMGLSMALDTFIAQSPSQGLAHLESQAAVIKEYVHKMQDNQGVAPESIPPEVDTAVMTAVNAMYEPIGMSQSQWNKKALGTFDNFERDVSRIIARLSDLRAKSAEADPSRAKGKITRGFRNIFQKKPLLADLDRILKAIDKRTGSFGEDGASQETKDKWNALREKVVQAKRSGN
jgi:hypothetical protein